MKKLLIFSIFLLFSLTFPKTLLVPEEFTTIQQAVFAAQNGDTVSILSDTRYLPEHLPFDNKNIFIRNRIFLSEHKNTKMILPSEILDRRRTLLQGWEGQRLVNRLDSVYDCTGEIACDQSDIPWIVWWGSLVQGGPEQIFFTRWNGTNWDEEQMVHSIDTFPNYQPRMTFDSEDRAWVAWTREEGIPGHGDWEVFYTRWNGTGWEPPMRLNPTNPRRDFAEGIAFGGNKMWVVATSFSQNEDSCAIFASRWNGISWDTLTRVSPLDSGWHWFSAITVDDSGRPHIVWCEPISGRIYYRMRCDTGWTSPIWINDPSTVRCDDWAAPAIAIDNNENLHVVWVGIASGESDQDIFYSKFDGQQWLAPLRINFNDDYDEYYPDIAASSQENIWAVWDKEAVGGAVFASYYDGVIWSIEERLDDPVQSSYNGVADIVLNRNDEPWSIWSGRTQQVSHWDVYSNRYLSTGISESKFLNLSPFKLFQNFPNPFCNRAVFSYTLIVPTYITLKVYNSNGSLIKTLIDSYKNSGSYSISWDRTDEKGKKVNSGVYFYKLSTKESAEIKQAVLVR